MPSDARGQLNRALESRRVFVAREFAGVRARRADEWINYEHQPPLVFPRVLANLERARLRRELPIHESRAIARHVLADGVQVVAAAAEVAGHLSADQRKNFVSLLGGLNMRINYNFERRFHAPRFLKQSKWKLGTNAEGVLLVNATLRKNELHFLPRGIAPRHVRKINRPRKNFRRMFGTAFAHDAQRNRRPNFLVVSHFGRREDRLFGEDV